MFSVKEYSKNKVSLKGHEIVVGHMSTLVFQYFFQYKHCHVILIFFLCYTYHNMAMVKISQFYHVFYYFF